LNKEQPINRLPGNIVADSWNACPVYKSIDHFRVTVKENDKTYIIILLMIIFIIEELD
jgi:hypothetical protein